MTTIGTRTSATCAVTRSTSFGTTLKIRGCFATRCAWPRYACVCVCVCEGNSSHPRKNSAMCLPPIHRDRKQNQVLLDYTVFEDILKRVTQHLFSKRLWFCHLTSASGVHLARVGIGECAGARFDALRATGAPQVRRHLYRRWQQWQRQQQQRQWQWQCGRDSAAACEL